MPPKMITKIRYVVFAILVLCFFKMCSSSQLSPKQKPTMEKLYELINSQTKLIISWNPNTDPCRESWAGVTCTTNSNNNSTIIDLSLSNLGLSNSSFLVVVCEIDTLVSLDVSRNLLTSIPDKFFSSCDQIGGLKVLNFSLNKISGALPTFSSGFTGLESLDFSRNDFSGEIGMNLDGLTGLKRLNLSYNSNLSGPVPVHLGKSFALEELQLSANSFQGPIPEKLGDYNNLTLIDLSFNQLKGTLSSMLVGKLSKLETLVLSSNFLNGSIPGNLASIVSLSRFAANQNQFSGTIPSGISKVLRKLDLSYNSLSGPIPDDLLSNNMETLDLSFNRLQGSIPEDLSGNVLVRLRLGDNSLTGQIPTSICDKLPKLVYLELENNTLNGSIPSGLGSCKNLQLLNLAQNKLSGELPVELTNLAQLTVLELQANQFVANIPSDIGKLSNLSTLNISSNHLNGTIPVSITSLRKLVNLDLQGNNLSGSIPKGVGGMSYLGEVHLGMNQLNGDIPPMSANLYTLNLRRNLFKGNIPESLSTLSNLQVLDLSYNNFSGVVPEFLTKITSLTELLLAGNSLSGTLPSFHPGVDVVTSPGNPSLINITAAPTTDSSYYNRKRASIGATIVIVLSAAITGVIVAVVVVILLRRFYRVREAKIETQEDARSHFIEGCLLTPNRIHRSNIDFSTSMEAVSRRVNIVMSTRYLTYYKVVMPSGSRYFVKKLNWSGKMYQLASQENFRKELEVLGRLNNSNVMVPLAYMLTDDSAYLFYEYAHKGTLSDILHGSSGCGLDWASRYSIAIGVAQGLAFLHGCSSGPILLFDLSSKSIMLKSFKEPQIGDIELSKVIDPSKSTGSLSAVAGSVGYIPPEYAYTMRITAAGNVYSFGVILLELITGKPAVSEGIELAKWVLSKTTEQQRWDYILDPSVSRKSVAVQSQMLAVLRIALRCVDVQAENRPKMHSIPRMLLNSR